MAVLTWKNVDAPDLRGSVDGYRTFGQLLNNATQGLNNGLQQFQEGRTAAADNIVARNQLSITDPEQMRQALANGSLFSGVDPTQVSARQLYSASMRPGQLLDAAVQQQALTDAQTAATRSQAGYDASRSAAPIIAEGAQAALRGDTAGVANTLSNPALAGLTPAQIQEYAANQQRVIGGSINNTSGQISNLNAGDTLMQNRRQYENLQEATALAEKHRRAVRSSDQLAQVLDAEGRSPEVNEIVRRLYAGRGFGDPDAPFDTAAATTGNRGANGIAGAVTAAGTARINIPETSNYVKSIVGRAGNITGTIDQKLEKLLPLVREQESGNRRFNADGSLVQGPMTRLGERAQGEMQVMGSTSRDPGFGVRPAKDDSPDELARVGKDYLKAMLTRYGGNVEAALAAYNAGPGRADEWYGTGQAAAAQQAVGDASDSVDLFLNQSQSGNVSARVGAAYDKKSTPGEEVDSLMSSDFKGGDRTDIANKLMYVQDRLDVTPAVASEILRTSYKARDTWLGFGSSVNEIDDRRLEASIERFRAPGGILDQLKVQRGASEARKTMSSAQTSLAEEEAKLNRIATSASTNPRLNDQIGPQQLRVEAARAKFALAQAAVNSFTPTTEAARPAPPRTVGIPSQGEVIGRPTMNVNSGIDRNAVNRLLEQSANR